VTDKKYKILLHMLSLKEIEMLHRKKITKMINTYNLPINSHLSSIIRKETYFNVSP